MKPTLQDIGNILYDADQTADRHFYGQIKSVNRDAQNKIKSYNVSLGTNSDDTVTCRKLAGAKVGDIVMVTLLKSGVAIVTGTVGGDTDAKDAQETADNAILRVSAIEADYIKTTTLEAAVAQIGFLKADSAVITDLQTNKLSADSAVITDLQAETAKVHNLTAAQLEAANAYIETLTAGSVSAANLVADHGIIGNLSTNYLQADFANIKHASLNKAQIGTLFNEVGLITSATIVDGHITGYLDAVEVNANKITAGTLVTSRLLLSGTATGNTSVLYELNNLGQLTSQNVDSLDGYVLTERTINADKIVSHSITANEVDVESLTASIVTATHIEALDLSTFDLNAWKATIGGFYIDNGALYSPSSTYNWDCTTTTSERSALNTALDLSESTTSWTYDDLTSSEMSALNTALGLSEGTSAWDTSCTYPEYRTLCEALELSYGAGSSVYVGTDGIGLGNNFFVDTSGKLVASDASITGTIYATAGQIGGWNIGTDAAKSLYYGSDVPGTSGSLIMSRSSQTNTKSIAGSATGLNWMLAAGDRFGVTTGGALYANRGRFYSGIKIGGFDIIAAADGMDYLKSDWQTGNIYYRTWIRSAEDADKGGTWAFSTQTSSDGTNYSGTFIAKSNGELFSQPVDSNDNIAGPLMRTTQSEAEMKHASGGWLKVDATGIYTYLNGYSTSSVANLLRDPNTGYLCQTTSNASSEQLKTDITEIKDEGLDPDRLYDVAVVQFRYKDGVLNDHDQRWGMKLVGFVIEDLEKSYPIAVDKQDKEDPRTWVWNNAYLIPPMLKLIQRQKAQIDALEERIDSLERKAS